MRNESFNRHIGFPISSKPSLPSRSLMGASPTPRRRPSLWPRSRELRFRGCSRPALLGLLATAVIFFSMNRIGFTAPLLPVPVSTAPTNGDQNPYGVRFVSGLTGGTLKAGDILVSNFNNGANPWVPGLP